MAASCPACFRALPDAQIAYVCTSPRCSPALNPVATAYAGFQVHQKPVTTINRPPDARRWVAQPHAFCTACGERTEAMVCPHCHWGPLLPGWRESETTCIAMAGARTTGKTLYIAVVVKQLQLLALQVNTTLTFADEQTRTTYTRFYEAPLYEQRMLAPPTSSVEVAGYQRNTLIFSFGTVNNRMRYVVIRDVAGEDLEKERVDTNFLQFLGHADAVFFLFDPLRVPTIRDQLVGVIPAQGVTGGNPQEVLDTILRVIGPGRPRVACIVSKFDAMQELAKVEGTELSRIMSNPGAAMRRDPSMNQFYYDENDGALLDLEIRSLLLKLRADQLVTTLERPRGTAPLRHRYFAVSALGAPPVGERRHSRGITPFRLVDPVKWVLTGNG